jgi:hypothetical protein
MSGAKHVPYENFLRLQLMLGEPLAELSKLCHGVKIPCPSLGVLGRIRSELLDSLPDECRNLATTDGLSQGFIENHIKTLQEKSWPYLQCLLQFGTRQLDFDKAWEYFATPDLRLRIDCLILSQRCSPKEISEALEGWSKYSLEESAVEIYSYFFCNLPVMKNVKNWQAYFQDVVSEDHRFFMGQAYDVQTKADLLVLASDLSVRSAITISSEETVRDLMRSAYVQMKKEEQKVRQGIPARNTAIFEWSGVFCSMFDRVFKLEEGAGDENAIETVQTNLVKLRQRKVRRLDEFEIAKPDMPTGDAA